MQELRTEEEKRFNSYDTASILSFVFYGWLTPLIDLGSKRPLDFDDVYPTPHSLSSRVVYDNFQTVWNKVQASNPGSGAANLGWMLVKCSSRPLLLSSLGFGSFAVVSLLQPYFIVHILEYVANGEVDFLGMKSGILISIGLTFISLIGILSFSIGFTHIQEAGFRTRNILISKIFDKSLKVSSHTRSKQTTGEIVTLMAADTERYWLGILMSNWLWLSPLVIAISLIILIVEFGLAAVIVSAVVGLWFVAFSRSSSMVGYYRAKIVKLTGERVKLMNEALQGIRVIKLYAWEEPTVERIEQIRKQETELMMKYQLTRMFNTVLQFVAPTIISSSLFVAVHALGGSLTIAKVYLGFSLLNVIRLPLSILPISLTAYKEGLKSHERVKKYLDSPEAVTPQMTDAVDGILVDIKNATFSWSEGPSDGGTDTDKAIDSDKNAAVRNSMNAFLVAGKEDPSYGAPVLRGVTLQVQKGEFIALVGEVGSGKTSLISALLGQLTLLSGEQTLSGRIAYVSQESWIQNITLKENILFSSPMDSTRYVEVLDASQLSQDLLTLPNADATEIGERGMNLSGGQKARVNIARALYAPNTDLYVFDDPMAAVDVHVGKELFQHALKEMLHDKARIVSLSSNYHFLSHFDKVVVILNGTTTICESYAELKERFPQYASGEEEEEVKGGQEEGELVTQRTSEEADQCSVDETLEQVKFNMEGGCDSAEEYSEAEGVEMVSPSPSRLSVKRRMQKGHSIYLQKRDSILEKQQSGKVLTTSEDRESGAVSMSTYTNYFSYATSQAKNPKVAGTCTLFVMFVLFLIAQVARVYTDLWPGLWASDQEKESSDMDDAVWFKWYLILLLITVAFSYARAFHLIVSCVWANISLHASIVGKVFAAPVNVYFDITPLGRILNRFSKDLDMLDSMLPDFLLQNVQNIFHLVAVLLMCALSSAFFALVVPVLVAMFYYIYSHFRKTSRELKRFDGVTRSPVYSGFGEMLNGISTIRAYGRQEYFFTQFCATADENFRHFFTFFQASRWLALRLDLVSNMVILFVSLIAVLMVDYGASVNENMLGMALVYSLQLMGMLQWTVRVTIETENNMTAAERLLTFNNIPSEAQRVIPSDPSTDSWPTRGHIVIKDLCMRYRPGLERVVSGVSLDIPGGCKVGVCGRTGAGKSSLMLALFRIVEPELGSSITLDDVDILTMGLDILRTQLTIIPQDPVMFSGSLRYNLDPFQKYSDLHIWEALDRAHLKEEILRKFPNKLNHTVSERGENISVGQKQLLCIARALLRKPKVIIMDEATASVDSATDKNIQATIREAFKDCTILTIAHRLETIADYDRVVVMEAGRVAEYASPHELLQREGGLFRGLVDQLGPEMRETIETSSRMRSEVSTEQDALRDLF